MREEIKKQIKDLVEKYESAKKTTEIRRYSEEDTIKDFILPLFNILGWDTSDKKEVSAQDHIKGSGRPDYTFKINGITQFYLEAKKLSADLDDEKFAFQAINYSWNKGITYAILTDFESIKVFNAQRIDKINLMDKLVFEIPYTKYIEEFDTLWHLSKQAFKDKKLDSLAEKYGKKEKSISVSSVIKKLNEDIQWCRQQLTHSFEVCNKDKNIPKDLLDEGVQKLLDRLIFLRVAEDRDVEPNILKNLLRQIETAEEYTPFQAMVSTFRELDKVYNSNLFSHHPFEEWEEWRTLKEVIERLYGKKGYYEYNFKEMPADVLGSVYESYLGYKLSTAKSKNKKLFDKDGREITIHKDAKKRKEQGIYYTPSFVVDYIVKNALKPVLDKCKSVNDLKKIKVLDPACGSGSFLIKALEAIAEKYKEFGSDNQYIKRQIIVENLYGVDLDMQAVQIAQLNLLINSLDTRDALPMLDKNIKNGNSLISGSDEDLEKQFGKNWCDKKPFNWQEEFPNVFKQGGFDVIIGNPPWGADMERVDKSFYKDNFVAGKGIIDTFALFTEKSMKLLNENGQLGFILPDIVLLKNYPQIRKLILENSIITNIYYTGRAFHDVNLDSVVLIIKKEKSEKKRNKNNIRVIINDEESKIKQELFLENTDYKFNLYFNDNIINLKKKLDEQSIKLGDILEIHEGIHSGNIRAKLFLDSAISKNCQKLLFKGVEVEKYFKRWAGKFVNYDKSIIDKSSKEYANLGKEEYFKNEKILVRRTGDKIIATIDKDGYFVSNNFFVLYPKKSAQKINLKYILAILNSKLGTWYFTVIQPRKGKLFAEIKINHLAEIPFVIRKDFKEVVKMTDKILSLNKQLRETPEHSEKWESLKSEIEKIDKKIDEEVYKLYGLTEKEIEIVENKWKNKNLKEN